MGMAPPQYEREQQEILGENENQNNQVLQPVSEETHRNGTIKERSQMIVVPELDGLAPGSEESFYPARHLLKLRAECSTFGRSPSPTNRKLNDEWMSTALLVRDHIARQKKEQEITN